MHIASKHLHSSLLTGLLVLGGLTVSFAAAQTESPVSSYVHSFVLPFPNSITEGQFAGAKFDIGAFMNHPCFTIAGTEAQSCKEQFGISASLKTYLDDGSLLSYLGTHGLLATGMNVSSSSESSISSASSESSASSASSVSSASSLSSSSVSSATDIDTILQERSDMLWDICLEMSKGNRAETTDCYQRNMKLFQRYNVPLEGNVY